LALIIPVTFLNKNYLIYEVFDVIIYCHNPVAAALCNRAAAAEPVCSSDLLEQIQKSASTGVFN
jgi:hypothetical protein